MMKVQEYLQELISYKVQDIRGIVSVESVALSALEALKDSLGIKFKLYEDRVVLNYCQIESPKTDPIVRECRGLILAFPSFEVMARGFDRFYNYGEAPEITGLVDFKRAKMYEKADGSYISVYFDGIKWQIATRGTAYAEAENYTGRIFRDMVLEAFGFEGKYPFDDFNTVMDNAGFEHKWTHIFEFTSPENRVVTRYEKPQMVWLASRNKETGEYISQLGSLAFALLDNSGFLKTRGAKIFDISTAEAALDAAKALPNLQEGFVAFDPVSGERVKIKSPTYVAVHHIKGEGLTPKRICQLLLEGEVAEYLEYYPEDAPQFEPYEEALKDLVWNMDTDFAANNHILDQKEFALRVKDKLYSSYLFTARAKRMTASVAFIQANPTAKLKTLLAHKERLDERLQASHNKTLQAKS